MRPFLKKALFLWVFFPCRIFSQVLNIEQERIQTDTTGWSGSARVAFDLAKNQTRLYNVNGRTHVQHKSDRSLILLLGEYGLIRGGDADFVNSGFGHLRYNYKVKPWLTAEAFTQGQANKILGIRLRALAGAGPRFRIIKTGAFRLYAAVLGMSEYEELLPEISFRRTLRLSSYLSWTAKISGVLKIVNTAYWQPAAGDPSDFRISAQTDFVMRLSKRFSYSLTHNYAYDSEPPTDVVNTAYSISNNLSFDFGG